MEGNIMGLMRRKRKIVRSAVAMLVTAGALTLATPAGPASANTSRDGKCESGEFCLYYREYSWRDSQGRRSSLSDWSFSVETYGAYQPKCYDFKSPGSGQGACVKNNAIGYWNRTSKTVKVFVLSYWNDDDGVMSIPSGAYGDLNYTVREDNASHCIGSTCP